MKLFNTMSMQKEEFVPIESGKVRMYACGPTVYNFIHVGNARPIIMFDVLRRYLEYRGYEVTERGERVPYIDGHESRHADGARRSVKRVYVFKRNAVSHAARQHKQPRACKYHGRKAERNYSCRRHSF